MQRVPLNHGSGADEEAFERKLDRALAHAPVPPISPEFAVRMAAMLPPLPSPHKPRFAYASAAMIACGIVLLVALFLLAPRAAVGSRFATALEWIVCVQLSVLAMSAALDRELWRLR